MLNLDSKILEYKRQNNLVNNNEKIILNGKTYFLKNIPYKEYKVIYAYYLQITQLGLQITEFTEKINNLKEEGKEELLEEIKVEDMGIIDALSKLSLELLENQFNFITLVLKGVKKEELENLNTQIIQQVLYPTCVEILFGSLPKEKEEKIDKKKY